LRPHANRRSRLGRFLLLSLLLCTTLLTACEDQPEPKIVEPTSTAPPTTSSTVPTTSAPPKRETAKQFVIRFQNEEALMKETGDATTYRTLSIRCSDCANLADAVEDIYTDGGRLVGKAPKISKVHRVGKVRDVWIFEFDYSAAPSRVLNENGKVITHFSGGELRFQINVRRVNGDWQVLRLRELVG